MQSVTGPPRLPAIIGGRYRVLRELGRGGFGAVYLVEHIHTGDHLALKVLYGQAARDPMSLERFKREARAAAQIKNDHVVRVVDADAAIELEGAPFLVMELLDGEDIEKLVERRGALLPEEVLGIFSEIARALDKAHALGIVHRDLKPENLFLHCRDDGSRMVKVLDFGISRAAGSENELAGAGRTATGAILGTPLYMAPEQARGISSEISPATDIWALGLIAFRLLTGHSYWQANTVAELLVNILTAEFVRPSQLSPLVPPSFDDWFFRSCDRQPVRRFRSVGDQTAALQTALGVTTSQIPSMDVGPLSAIPLAPLATAFPPRSEASALGSSRSTGVVSATGAPMSRTTPTVVKSGTSPLVVGGAVVSAVALTLLGGWLVPKLTRTADQSVVASTSLATTSPSAMPASSVAPAPVASASASGPVAPPPSTAGRLVAGGKKAPPIITPVVTPTTADKPPATTPPPVDPKKPFSPTTL